MDSAKDFQKSVINSRCIVKGMHAYAHLGCQCDLHAGLILAFLSFTIILQGKTKNKKSSLFFSDYSFTFIPVECFPALDY